MRVVFPFEVCWTRKESEGTANLASGSLGVMKNFSERVREPAERAWIVRLGLETIASVWLVLADLCQCFVYSPTAVRLRLSD